MQTITKLVLLAATLIVTMGFGAPVASSSSAVEVSEEVTGIHCSVAASNCLAHVVGESRLEVSHPGGFIVTACNDEFEASFNEDGSGAASNVWFVDKTVNSCWFVPCPGVDWPISGAKEIGPDTSEATMTTCLSDEQACDLDLSIVEIALHVYELSTETLCPSGTTWIGRWTAEGKNIEIAHI